jgi:alanyl aminopeptidase
MLRIKVIPALLGIFLSTSIAAAAESVDYRLPPEIQPIAQSIDLMLDPSKPDYSGKTVLQIDVEKDVDRIGIYQLGLDMSSIKLRSDAGERTLQAEIGDYDINWLSDGARIPAGQYELSIDFNGNFTTDALGMHRTHFEGNDYIFTQMESMYLRRAIPSFDEPSFKIPYTLTINAPADLVVVANTPVESESEADGWRRVEFMATKPLSSYLIAYGVGPLDRAKIEGMSVPGYIYVPKGHADELGFVLQHTAPIVKSLEEYFGTDYPFRKLDFLGVPEFAYGAMENAGLITYRAEYLTVGDHTTGGMAAYVLSTIAHEVGHMWFGDLVTMEWWNDLWLNEAFASWIDELIFRRLYPEFESHLSLPQTAAFAIDQGTGVKAIRKVTRTESDTNEGSYLPYVKGQTLLWMLEGYVGAEKWQQGVRQYIEKFSWGNATEPDLWKEISDVSGIDVSKIAGSFLNQPGFPILKMDKDGGISQERYLPYGLEAPDLQWTIPLNVKYKKDGEVKEVFYLLDDKTGVIDLPQGADWILPDAGAAGYFRWQTDIDQFYALVEDIASLENREKIGLLDNSDALFRARKLSLEDYMFVLTKLLDESHPLVLLPSIEKVLIIGSNYVTDDNAAAFARFVDAELGEHFAAVGIETREGDSEVLIQLRPRLVRLVGQFGSDPAVRIAAAEKADLYLASTDAVDSNLADEFLRVTALNDNGDRYEKYIEAYLASDDARQKTNILRSIYFQDPAVVRKALDFAMSDAVLASDAGTILELYPTVLDDHTILYEWLEENLDVFEASIPSLGHRTMPTTMGGICNEKNLSLLQEFFGNRDDKYKTDLARRVEITQSCINDREFNDAALMEFLEQYDE